MMRSTIFSENKIYNILDERGCKGFDRVKSLYMSASCATTDNHIKLFRNNITANDAEYGLALAA